MKCAVIIYTLITLTLVLGVQNAGWAQSSDDLVGLGAGALLVTPHSPRVLIGATYSGHYLGITDRGNDIRFFVASAEIGFANSDSSNNIDYFNIRIVPVSVGNDKDGFLGSLSIVAQKDFDLDLDHKLTLYALAADLDYEAEDKTLFAQIAIDALGLSAWSLSKDHRSTVTGTPFRADVKLGTDVLGDFNLPYVLKLSGGAELNLMTGKTWPTTADFYLRAQTTLKKVLETYVQWGQRLLTYTDHDQNTYHYIKIGFGLKP